MYWLILMNNKEGLMGKNIYLFISIFKLRIEIIDIDWVMLKSPLIEMTLSISNIEEEQREAGIVVERLSSI